MVEGMTEEEAADLYAKATGCSGAAPAEASAEPEFKKLGAAVSVGFDIETSNDNVMDKFNAEFGALADGEISAGDLRNIRKREKMAKKDELREARIASQRSVFQSDFVKRHRSDHKGGRDLRVTDISFSTPSGELLLDGGDLLIAHQRRYGMVGRNGVGKSTLLKGIAYGEIPMNTGLQVLVIEQEVIGDDTTALECILKTDVEREELLAAEAEMLSRDEKNTDDQALNKIYERMQEIDAGSAPARASAILAGLGIIGDEQQKATKAFSG